MTGRSKPIVLLSHIDPKSLTVTEICRGHGGVWAVCLDGEPVNVRSRNPQNPHLPRKYKRVAFANAGHALVLVRRLNALFKTDRFSAVWFD